jgi:hypothetical protein
MGRKVTKLLTSYQCQTAAWVTDGAIICTQCAANGETREMHAISRYEVDEYDSESSRDYEGDEDEHVEDCECTYGITCDDCGTEIVEPYVDSDCKAKQDEDE